MLRRKLSNIAKRSALNYSVNAYERRQAIIESVTNQSKTGEYNPRTAKYRSLKGVFNTL